MKRGVLFRSHGILAILCFLLGICAQAQPATLALRGATVVGVTDGAFHPEQTVLLEVNPLEDITNTQRIRAVAADGRLYLRDDLNRLLAEPDALTHGQIQFLGFTAADPVLNSTTL